MKNNDDVYKYIIYGIIFITFLCIVVNPSTRKFFLCLSEINKIEQKIEQITIEKEKYKKRLNYLKTNPKELEKAVKMNSGGRVLGVLATNEIEYIFIDEEKEDSN